MRTTTQRILKALTHFNWYRYFCLMAITGIVLLIGVIIGFQWGDSLLVNPIVYGA